MYKEPEQWSDDVTPQRKMFRAPSNYGYITAIYTPIKPLDISLSGVYTGSMLVQHFVPFIPEDVEPKFPYITEDTEVITPAFFDMGLKIAYNFKLKENISLQLNTGMKNIFNSYQNDFDRGEFRDAGYFYGPTLPRTVFFGVKLLM
jgi:outer membrane receptor for ferrienterochelin and colicins